jgi:uncharacterized protein YegP (UPF0339 family)
MSGAAHYSDPFEGKDGQWYWHLKAVGGEIVSQSEGYSSKEHAAEGIDAAKRAAAAAVAAEEDRA